MFERLTERLPNGVVRTGLKGDSIILRLAAYEDSGLSPEEVRELAKAEADGRLVVLPCKVGDTIFTICWNIKNQKYEVRTGEVKNVRCDAIDGSVMVSDGEYYRVWGKTGFLTSEAAEKALAEVVGE